MIKWRWFEIALPGAAGASQKAPRRAYPGAARGAPRCAWGIAVPVPWRPASRCLAWRCQWDDGTPRACQQMVMPNNSNAVLSPKSNMGASSWLPLWATSHLHSRAGCQVTCLRPWASKSRTCHAAVMDNNAMCACWLSTTLIGSPQQSGINYMKTIFWIRFERKWIFFSNLFILGDISCFEIISQYIIWWYIFEFRFYICARQLATHFNYETIMFWINCLLIRV